MVKAYIYLGWISVALVFVVALLEIIGFELLYHLYLAIFTIGLINISFIGGFLYIKTTEKVLSNYDLQFSQKDLKKDRREALKILLLAICSYAVPIVSGVLTNLGYMTAHLHGFIATFFSSILLVYCVLRLKKLIMKRDFSFKILSYYLYEDLV